jgi:hypothetical protein
MSVAYEARAKYIISRSKHMAVPYYLMASYAYYEQDDPIFSDAYYDELANFILNNYDTIDHYHKYLISKDDLEAGSYLGSYPSKVIGGLGHLRNTVGTR